MAVALHTKSVWGGGDPSVSSQPSAAGVEPRCLYLSDLTADLQSFIQQRRGPGVCLKTKVLILLHGVGGRMLQKAAFCIFVCSK